MPVLADLAARRYEGQGQPGLTQLLDSLSLANRSRFWLLDPGGSELSGRPLPDRILRGAASAG